MGRRLWVGEEVRRRVPTTHSERMLDFGTGRRHILGVSYVTQREFDEMQTELRKQIENQTDVLEELLKLLRLYLAIIVDGEAEE